MLPTLLKRNGKYIVDAGMMDAIPAHLLTDRPNTRVSISANDSAGPYSMTVGNEGPVVIDRFSAQRTGVARVELRIQDGSSPMGYGLMNSACHIDTIFGNNLRPFALPCGLFLQENHALEAWFTDLSGEANVVALNIDGTRYRRPMPDPTGKLQEQNWQRRQYVTTPYFYTIAGGKVALTSGGTGTAEIPIDSGHNFEVVSIQYVSTGTFNINIFNQATGDSLICGTGGRSFEIPNTLVCGTAQFPRKLHEPFLVGAGQKLLVTLTDTSLATNTVYLTLAGVATRTGEHR